MNDSRAWKAGEKLAESIIEMIHLMYQKNTALNFIRGLCIKLNGERDRREKEMK